jgi:hypothetical protein
MVQSGRVDTVAQINITFPIGFTAIAAVALLLLTAFFWYESQSAKDTLIFFGAGVAAVGQLAAAFYTARMLAAALNKDRADGEAEQKREERDARHEEREAARDKFRLKLTAMDFGRRWNDPGMFHARDTLREIFRRHDAKEELKEFIEERQTNVIHCLNFLEEFATSCRYGLSDEELLRNQFDEIVVSIWRKLNPWIESHRESRRNKAIWEDLEWAFDRWK